MSEERLKEIESLVNANNLIMQMIPISIVKELLAEIKRLREKQ